MSHSHERKEKNCLNCGAEVAGRYCQVCGQENIVVKESFAHLVLHFFNDITHFDGKFFNSARYLLTKPGKLTHEYVSGRRVRYLHPIRMYVFTSALFFLLYFSFFSKHEETHEVNAKALSAAIEDKEKELDYFKKLSADTTDAVFATAAGKNIVKTRKDIEGLKARLAKLNAQTPLNKVDSLIPGDAIPVLDSIKKELAKPELRKQWDSVRVTDRDDVFDKTDLTSLDIYQNEAVYIAMQNELPASRKDGVLKKGINMKLLHWLGDENRNNTNAFAELKEKFKHSFPTLLFVSLPIFAFLLKLLYIRRKHLYYSDHGIFAIHSYCALFLLLLLFYSIEALNEKLHWSVVSVLSFLLAVYMYYYVYKAMRNFYEQGRLKTLAKFLLLNVMTSVVMLFLVAVFFVITALRA